ncbi:MAG TPA: hypothetical protein VK386_02115 [Acidimicrobiales bacterium]|nr:hypothetical protein [Acidimicrobiales bacterium]
MKLPMIFPDLMVTPEIDAVHPVSFPLKVAEVGVLDSVTGLANFTLADSEQLTSPGRAPLNLGGLDPMAETGPARMATVPHSNAVAMAR